MTKFGIKQLTEMPRTRSRATGMGTSSDRENLNKYDDLLRCRTTTEEEEEEQQQQQEVLKKRKKVVRFNEKAFAETITDLPAERLKLLEDSPFYKLVEMMSGHVQNNEVIKKLASLFSTNNKSLSLLLDGTRCIVTPQDFTSIMGVEDGDEDVIILQNSKTGEEPEETKIFLTKNGKVSNVNILEQLTHTTDYDTLRRAFALLAMQKIICAPLNGTLSRSYLKYVRDVSLLRKKKWATHAIHLLVRSINTYKNGRGTTTSLGGCTVFLLLYVRKKISETIPDELSDETRKKMIADKLDELLETRNKERADYSERVRLVKDIMRQRNASMISALEKVEKQCLSKVKNKKAKDFLKNDFEAVMFEIGRLLDARMTFTDSILESEARSEEEFRRRKVISQKRKAENALEKDAAVGKQKKARRKVIEPKHAMQTRSQQTLQPIGDRNFEQDRNAEGVRNVRNVERDRNVDRDRNLEHDRNVDWDRNVERDDNAEGVRNVDRDKNVERERNVDRDRDVERDINVDWDRVVERGRNVEGDRNAEMVRNVERDRKVERDRDVEGDRNVDRDRNVERGRNVKRGTWKSKHVSKRPNKGI